MLGLKACITKLCSYLSNLLHSFKLLLLLLLLIISLLNILQESRGLGIHYFKVEFSIGFQGPVAQYRPRAEWPLCAASDPGLDGAGLALPV